MLLTMAMVNMVICNILVKLKLICLGGERDISFICLKKAQWWSWPRYICRSSRKSFWERKKGHRHVEHGGDAQGDLLPRLGWDEEDKPERCFFLKICPQFSNFPSHSASMLKWRAQPVCILYTRGCPHTTSVIVSKNTSSHDNYDYD